MMQATQDFPRLRPMVAPIQSHGDLAYRLAEFRRLQRAGVKVDAEIDAIVEADLYRRCAA